MKVTSSHVVQESTFTVDMVLSGSVNVKAVLLLCFTLLHSSKQGGNIRACGAF